MIRTPPKVPQRLDIGAVMCGEFEAIHGQVPPTDISPNALSDHASLAEQAYWQAARERPQAALCLSGGGIRSAAYCLGVVQALAENGALKQFHYLSTVSGGGFIGGWLTRLIHDCKCIEELSGQITRQARQGALERLRSFTNYLTPEVGPFSADTWTSVLLYLRNLIVNWLMFIPLLFAAAVVPSLYNCLLTSIGANGALAYVLASLSSGLLLVAVSFACMYLPSHRPYNQGVPARLGRLARRAGPARPVIDWLIQWLPPQDDPPSQQRDGRPTNQRRYKSVTAIRRAIVVPALAWIALLALALGHPVLGQTMIVPIGYFFVMLGAYLLASIWQRGYQLPEGIYWMNAGWWMIACFTSAMLLWLFLFTAQQLVAPADTPDLLTTFGPLALALTLVLQSTIHLATRREVALSDLDREWVARVNASILRAALAWSLFAFCCLVLPRLVFSAQADWPGWAVAITALGSGSAAAWLGKLAQVGKFLDTSRFVRLPIKIGAPILSVCFIVALLTCFGRLAGIAIANVRLTYAELEVWPGWWLDHLRRIAFGDLADDKAAGTEYFDPAPFRHAWENSPLPSHGVLLIILLAVLLLVQWRINGNRFSLHAIYRNRVARAFLGTARSRRDPDRYTNFDPDDTIPLKDCGQGEYNGARRLFPLINMTLNLTHHNNTAWSERQAASFTATPLTCGSTALKLRLKNTSDMAGGGVFVRTEDYAGQEHSPLFENTRQPANLGMSLASAMTLSGAAISPNWGYNSSKVMAFPMTLFNMRLGAWLPNPAVVDSARALRVAMPPTGFRTWRGDLFGVSTATQSGIYLSDGGHFENLGLYEVLRRHCRTIVVVDAGHDPEAEFADLGNALRKAAIDLHAEVTMTLPTKATARAGAGTASPVADTSPGCAFGKVKYLDGTEGLILYISPSWQTGLPADIYAYGEKNPDFPHEKTLDQWFSESQFESYRNLGFHQASTLTKEKRFEAFHFRLNATSVQDLWQANTMWSWANDMADG